MGEYLPREAEKDHQLTGLTMYVDEHRLVAVDYSTGQRTVVTYHRKSEQWLATMTDK